MLSPKRTKYRKMQKGNNRGIAHAGSDVSFGDFGLQASEPARLTSRQIEAARMAIQRHVKRAGKLIFRERITEHRDANGELVVTARSVGVTTERPVDAS